MSVISDQGPHLLSNHKGAELDANSENVQDDYNKTEYKRQLAWPTIIRLALLHLAAIIAFWKCIQGHYTIGSQLYKIIVSVLSLMGINCGAHRLWSHRSYKANWQLRVLLTGLQTVALQNSIYDWCRDHRSHHRYCETDADPHNAKRGFFFAHMGWLMCRKHREVTIKGKEIDTSDLRADPVVWFQHKYYKPLAILTFLITMAIPVLWWGESWYMAFMGNCFRYIMSLHHTWLVNSWAHLGTHWSYRPYDKHINPCDTRTYNYLALGEGWHNYHHTFPWDYSASEFGWSGNWNTATAFIDMFACIGWAYDRRRPKGSVVKARVQRTGDFDEKYNELTGVYRLVDSMTGLAFICWPVWLPMVLNYIFV